MTPEPNSGRDEAKRLVLALAMDYAALVAATADHGESSHPRRMELWAQLEAAVAALAARALPQDRPMLSDERIDSIVRSHTWYDADVERYDIKAIAHAIIRADREQP